MLKTTKITLIHKTGPTNNPKNDRPISQLSEFSKTFESFMKLHLTCYLESKSISNTSQYGFRQNCSTFTALNKSYNAVFYALDNILCAIRLYRFC